MGEAWSDEENAATVRAYLDMLQQQLTDQHYVKAHYRRELRARFGRSDGAYEQKFMNISSVLRDLHYVYIHGYQPKGHRQKSLEHEVRRQLMERDGFLTLMERHVDQPAAPRLRIDWFPAEAPEGLSFLTPSSHPAPAHIDFVAREAANRTLGLAGEIAMCERERALLTDAGRPDLAARVVHASKVEGDGLGYDIRSWAPDGSDRFIEVKTTRQAIHWPMLVTRHEVHVSRDLGPNYVLARIFNFHRKKTGIYELPGAIEDTCILEPTTFEALPAS